MFESGTAERHREQTAGRPGGSAAVDAVLQRCVAWTISLLLLASIAFMGGRYDWGWLAWTEPVLVAVAALAVVLWLVRLMVRPQLGLVLSWSLALPAAAALIGALQVIELPRAVLGFCSPGLGSFLPTDSTPEVGGLPAWTRASLAPWRTVECLRWFGLYALIFFLIIQNVRTTEAVKQMLRAVWTLGVLLAFFGVAEYLFWNGKFYWFFEIPWVKPTNLFRGPYTNKNHFAGWLAMAVGPGCYCLLSALGLLNNSRLSGKIRDYFLPIGCFAFCGVLAAAFLSVSRGGIIATTTAFVIAAAGLTCYTRSKQIWLFVSGVMCVGFAVLLGFAGTAQIEERLATLGLGELGGGDRPEARLELWQALLRAVPDFPALGTGFGTHEYVYPLYLKKVYATRFTHAENSFLQLLVEGGAASAILTALALCCIGYWIVAGLRGTKRPEMKPCMVAVAAALAAAAVHGAVDFVWYIPSHALLLAVLTGLACAMARMQNPWPVVHFPFAPRCWAGAAALALTPLFFFWLQTGCAHARASLCWTEFQTMAVAQDADAEGDGQPIDTTSLTEALSDRPDQAMYHAALGECLRRRFLQSAEWRAAPMPLLQLRAAVRDSRFATAEHRDRWMESLYGSENRMILVQARKHFREVVRLCPLNGRGYLRLAELDFVAPEEGSSPQVLVEQAVRVRPNDPELCYEAGVDFVNQGDMVRAMECWRRSARRSEKHKQAILAQLVVEVPLTELVEHFQPDYESLLGLARERFTGKEQRNVRLFLLGKAKELTREELNPEVVGPRMRRLYDAFVQEHAAAEAGQCARMAVAAEPHLVSTRLILAHWLVQQRMFKEAKTELDWCALRAADNPEVRVLRNQVFEAMTAYPARRLRAMKGNGGRTGEPLIEPARARPADGHIPDPPCMEKGVPVTNTWVPRKVVKLLFDCALLVAAYYFAFLIRFEESLRGGWSDAVKQSLACVVILQYLCLAAYRAPQVSWQYFSLLDVKRTCLALVTANIVLVLCSTNIDLVARMAPAVHFRPIPRGVVLIDLLLALAHFVGVRVGVRMWLEGRDRNKRRTKKTPLAPTLLIGAGRVGAEVVKEVANHPELGIQIVGFLDDDARKHGMVIQGVCVLDAVAGAGKAVSRYGVTQAFITIGKASGGDIRRIVDVCQKAGLATKIIPAISCLLDGKVNLSALREVAIDDLLPRKPISLDLESIISNTQSRTILITGAGGSIGSELCRTLCRLGAGALLLVEQAENNLFHIHRELLQKYPATTVVPCVADICDFARMQHLMKRHRPEIVFHAAAHKHVPMMEWNIGEAVKNNILGTRMIGDLAHRYGVSEFVMISTDKAVKPTSVMGVSKRVAEIYLQSLSQKSQTRFVTVRFGNVLGSAGSVIPTFAEQIRQGGPITITHPDMCRYFMTIPEACALVLQAASLGKGGEIFILDMGEPVKIVDLARDVIRLSGLSEGEVEICYTGLRPGEKLVEELCLDEESATRTTHPKIFIGRLSSFRWDEINTHINELRALADRADVATLLSKLKDIVPEYQAGPPSHPPRASSDAPLPGPPPTILKMGVRRLENVNADRIYRPPSSPGVAA